MGGLYNMVNGTHPLFAELMGIMGYTQANPPKDIPRLRDIYLYKDEIRILTRTGGGNREEYEEGNAGLMAKPGYIRNWDDEYDNTYAWWAYEWPEEYREPLQMMYEAIEENRPALFIKSLKEPFEAAIEAMKGAE